MGPISIAPQYLHQGFGRALLDYSLEQASKAGFGAVCIEGDIDFYGKSGFALGSTFGIDYHGMPAGEEVPFFLCKELIPGYLSSTKGTYHTPQGYFVDEGEAEAFDKTFPPKEKAEPQK